MHTANNSFDSQDNDEFPIKELDCSSHTQKNKLRGLSPQLPSDRLLSAQLMPTFADRGRRVVSATDPHGR
jgi:hypothetical protein